MKYKVFIALAMVALIAAGCNKTENTGNTENTQQETQNNAPEQASTPADDTPSTPSGSTPASTSQPVFSGEDDLAPIEQPEVREVKITAAGFSPSTITIMKGDYVQFTNTDSAKHWPASDPHPAHNGLPGFDAKKGLANGEKYTFQFMSTGTFTFHDHMNPSLKGTVVVK
jgi:plastocyanin